ncbi:MAG TPA: inositol monophosphatase [Candidatus Gracilibacteria bacterium]|nr:inositol monophosphatase [Candidatus Gracilibacteria bacterium]
MLDLYPQIIAYLQSASQRLQTQMGQISDIGITKKYLTAEDLRIERDLKALIHQHHPQHGFFAEEENDQWLNQEDVWVVDPISGTQSFIKGLAHYGIVISHLHQGQTVFAAIADPSTQTLYTAYKNGGSYKNGERLQMYPPSDHPKIILHLALSWPDPAQAQAIFSKLTKYSRLYRTWASQGVNYCHIASGIYDGGFFAVKDNFPDFAGRLIIEEGGGMFRNLQDTNEISPSDRIFWAGHPDLYPELRELLIPLFKK